MARCKNCDTPVETQFCPQCGQRRIELDRPLPDLLGEVLRETFDVDGREFRTLRTLFLRPGVLSSEFLAGRRRHYTPPLRLYLIISVLFFLVAEWVVGSGMLLSASQTLEADAPGQAQLIGETLPQLMFLLLPAFALMLKLAFARWYYFAHLIHALHLHSAAYVVLAIMLPLEQSADQHLLFALVQFVLIAYLCFYVIASLRQVYAVSWAFACFKGLLILIAYIVVIAASLEATSQLSLGDNATIPFLSD